MKSKISLVILEKIVKNGSLWNIDIECKKPDSAIPVDARLSHLNYEWQTFVWKKIISTIGNRIDEY